MNGRIFHALFLSCTCFSSLACGGDSSPSGDESDAGTPSEDAGDPAQLEELSAAVIAKYMDCDYYEPTNSDADYAVEDSFDACKATCLVDATCDELKSAVCDAASGALAECLDACQPSLSLPGGFACDNGRSIPHAYVCDLSSDCLGGEDEQGCGTFTCDDGRVLASRKARCNQKKDCADGSDEQGCKLAC